MATVHDHDGRRRSLVAFMKAADALVRLEERNIAAATSHVAHGQRSGLEVLSHIAARAQQLDAARKKGDER